MEKFTFKTRQGSMRLFVLLFAIVLALALLAQVIITRGYKVTVSEVNMEIRGGRLNMEIYRPTVISKDTKLPCMILALGGSECIATPSIHAWEYAKRGFVVINVNMYGAGLSDMPEYMEDGADENNYSRNSGTHGLWDALEYARTIDYVDNTRIGIWGHSQGYTIGGTVPVYDQNMYTLNDRLLNVLYNEFGIQIPEEDLLKNADDIAKAKLNAAQMAVYKVRKAECEEIVANYVKAVRIIESGSINLKCTVAGHEVTRNLQCNLQVGGETRGGACGPFVNVNNRQDLGLFNRTEPLTDNSWFAVGDADVKNPNGTSTLLGGICDVTVNNSAALKAAIDANNAYFFYDPVIHHNGNLWNTTAIGYTLQFFTQCLGYNNGELSDPATQPISCTNIASSWIALFIMCAAMLVMTIAICALGSALLKTDYFSTCLKPCYESKLAAGSKDFWIATALAVVTAFVGGWISSRENIALKASNAFLSNFLPTEPGQWRTYFQIIGTAACDFVLFGVMSLIGRKTNKTDLLNGIIII